MLLVILIRGFKSLKITKECSILWINENKIQIKYYFQENQGKMLAINKICELTTGDVIIDCDSDDYFTKDALKIIKEEFENTRKEGLYGICFLKQNQDGKIDGTSFQGVVSTMFDLYFKQATKGEKVLVYYSDVRKKYKHELENNEKFITEARMYHKIDENYKIKCVNKPVQIGDYRKDRLYK